MDATTPESAAEPTVASRADAVHERHVVVVGGGVAGLVAALECAKVGLRVTVLEAAPELGGGVRPVEVGGIVLDAAVEGFSARGAALAELAGELGLTVSSAAPARAWVAGPRGAAPLPEGSLLGIPANPWDESVRRIIGWRGVWRAYLDRLRPPLTIGHERSLGRLVRTRMGERVLERLVAPVSVGGYGIHPDDVDVELAAPGLSAALTRTGSLGGAVAQLRGDETAGPAARPLLATIDGGMHLLVAALRDRLVDLGADVRTDARVVALVRRDGGRWDAEIAQPADEEATLEPIAPADAVIVATPEAESRRLVGPHAPALRAPAPEPTRVEVVTLVVDASALDAAPRGDAVLTVAGTHRATSLVHSTARWPALAARMPASTHLLRVTFGSAGAPPATEGLDDDAAVRLARSEAEALLGVPLRVTGGVRERFEAVRPAAALGQAEAARAARSAVHGIQGLAVTGGWVSGSGLAQVVPDALSEAERVRRHLLFEASGPVD